MMDVAAVRQRHGLAAREQQVSDLLDRLNYSGDLAATAFRHRDRDGFLYWFYGLKQDVTAVAALARELRDRGGR
jgi:hypothetical protein